MFKNFSIENIQDNLIFKCSKDIEISLSIKEIIKENTENGFIKISGCVEDSFEKFLNHSLANGSLKEILEKNKDEICEKIARVYFEYLWRKF